MFESKNSEKNIFNLLAPWYDRFRKIVESGEIVEISQEIEKIERSNDRTLKILDVGGGTGNHWREKVSDGKDFYLLDENRSMLSHSEEEIRAIQGDAQSTPFKEKTFDVVLCVDALHHFDDRLGSLEEMDRMLKPKGKIIFVDFDPENILTRGISLIERSFGEPGTFIPLHSLKNFFEKKGYSSKLKRLNSYMYLFTFQKNDA